MTATVTTKPTRKKKKSKETQHLASEALPGSDLEGIDLDAGMHILNLISRVGGNTIGRLTHNPQPIGFLENWLTDLIHENGEYGMHEEDRIAKVIIRQLTERFGENFMTNANGQDLVDAERRRFDEEFPGASLHYRGRYWQLFVKLLRRYLDAYHAGINFGYVEGWVFNAYDEMMDAMPDEEVPEVLIHPRNSNFSQWKLGDTKRMRPSLKDGGRIVKGVMSYITAQGWFGKQYARRPVINE